MRSVAGVGIGRLLHNRVVSPLPTSDGKASCQNQMELAKPEGQGSVIADAVLETTSVVVSSSPPAIPFGNWQKLAIAGIKWNLCLQTYWSRDRRTNAL